MSRSEDLYLAAPEWLQHLMVRFYGHKLYRKRYSGVYWDLLEKVREAKNWSPEKVNAYQCERLHEMVRYCYENIPYYQQLFAKLQLTPDDINTLNDLKKIPILDKQSLRERPNDFMPVSGKKAYTVQHTSGSTGTPLALHTDEVTYKLAMALLVDFEEGYGVAFGAPRATFAGRMLKASNNMKPPFWRYNKAENQLIFSSYHINKETFPYYAKALDRFQPLEIIGYPSAICELATQYLDANLRPGFQPRLIVTNSENLLDWQRERIETAFKCNVRDYYSTAEYVNFAGEDNNGHYPSNPLLGITEFEPIEASCIGGNLIMTTLTNHSMPLIRYRVGDIGFPAKTDNPLYGAPVLNEIEGRIDDYLETANGRRIGRVSQVFKGLSGIREAQVFQKQPGAAILRVVLDGSRSDDEEQLIRNAQLRLGSDFHLEVDYVQEIPRSKNGKFRFVVKA
jgi:phenylacetate-CoA ligase